MKKINYILLSGLMLGSLYLSSCDEENGRTTFEGPYYTQFTATSQSISENSTGQADVEVSNVGPTLDNPVTVNYSIDPSSTAVEGVDYQIIGASAPGQIVIPAGQHFGIIGIKPIDNFASESDRTIVLNLTSADQGLNAGRGEIGIQHTVTIVDNDCPINLDGDFSTVINDTNPGGCAGVTSNVTVTKVSDNPDGSITYSISDITGGLYPDCYGSAANTAEFILFGQDILVQDQPDVVYGADVFNGVGTANCDGTFVLAWSNGFGDAPTTTHTP